MKRICLKAFLLLWVCLALLPRITLASASDTAYGHGAGSWKGIAMDTYFGKTIFYEVRITMAEDGSGILAVSYEGTTSEYVMKDMCSSPFDKYIVHQADYPDDPLKGYNGKFMDETLSLGYHHYQDPENPGWLTVQGTTLLPLSAWEKPYADVSEGYTADGVTLTPAGFSVDQELIRQEYNEYDPDQRYLIVRFVLDQPQGIYTIEDSLSRNIYLRYDDGSPLRNRYAVIYPGGRDSGRTYLTFDLLFYSGKDPEALICYETAFDLSAAEEITEVFSADRTDRGLIERYYTRLKNGELPVLEGDAQIRGKIVTVIVNSAGSMSISTTEGARYRESGWPDYEGIPYELLAENVEEAGTIVFITERHLQTGTYANGSLALKTFTEMTVVDPAQDAAYAKIPVAEDDPPEVLQVVNGRGNGSGDFKTKDAFALILEMAGVQ